MVQERGDDHDNLRSSVPNMAAEKGQRVAPPPSRRMREHALIP